MTYSFRISGLGCFCCVKEAVSAVPASVLWMSITPLLPGHERRLLEVGGTRMTNRPRVPGPVPVSALKVLGKSGLLHWLLQCAELQGLGAGLSACHKAFS